MLNRAHLAHRGTDDGLNLQIGWAGVPPHDRGRGGHRDLGRITNEVGDELDDRKRNLLKSGFAGFGARQRNGHGESLLRDRSALYAECPAGPSRSALVVLRGRLRNGNWLVNVALTVD